MKSVLLRFGALALAVGVLVGALSLFGWGPFAGVSYQPPGLPIKIQWDTETGWSVAGEVSVVTPAGRVSLEAGSMPVPEAASDGAFELVVATEGAEEGARFEIHDDALRHIWVDGTAHLALSENQAVVTAASEKTTIAVTASAEAPKGMKAPSAVDADHEEPSVENSSAEGGASETERGGSDRSGESPEETDEQAAGSATETSSSAEGLDSHEPDEESTMSAGYDEEEADEAADPPPGDDVEVTEADDDSADWSDESDDDSKPADVAQPGLYLKNIQCERTDDSVRVSAEVLQLGDVDGYLTYRIDDGRWETDQVFSETTPQSRSLEVTGVNYTSPVKCEVYLQAEEPTYLQGYETMSD